MSSAALAVEHDRPKLTGLREGLPPGPSEPSLIQTFRYVRHPVELIEECQRCYGDLFSWRVQRGGPPMVLVGDPDMVNEVLKGDPEILRSGEANALLSSLLGRPCSCSTVIDTSASGG
jgi:cytochrome P450